MSVALGDDDDHCPECGEPECLCQCLPDCPVCGGSGGGTEPATVCRHCDGLGYLQRKHDKEDADG